MTEEKKLQDDKSFYESERRDFVGFKTEIATFRSDGTVLVIYKGALPDGQPTLAHKAIPKSDSEFIEVCKSFKLNQPGDSYFKTYRRVDENWVLDSEGENKR